LAVKEPEVVEPVHTVASKPEANDSVQFPGMAKVDEKPVHPPQVPGRSSSRNVLREMSIAKMNSPQPPPHLQLVNVSVSPAPSSRLSTSPSLETLSPNIIQVTVVH